MRDEPADGDRAPLARPLGLAPDQLEQEGEARQVALRAAPLERQLGRDLLPAVALAADAQVLGDQGVLEHDLVEVVGAAEVDDRADRDPGRREVHEELREPLVLLVGDDLRAEERDQVLRAVRVARPDLGAVDPVAAVHALGARADRGEIRARVGLAHADRERQLAARDRGQEALALGLGAEAEQQRPALAVRHPVRADRRPRGQHLLEHHVALEEAPLVTTVARGPRHPDPPARAHLAAERRVEAAPGVRALGAPAVFQLGAQEVAHLGAERLGRGRQVGEVEPERVHDAPCLARPAAPRNRRHCLVEGAHDLSAPEST